MGNIDIFGDETEEHKSYPAEEEFETRSSLKESRKFKRQLMFWNVLIAVLICAVLILGFFIVKPFFAGSENDDKVYSGSLSLMSEADDKEIRDYHIAELKKDFGIDFDANSFSDSDIEKALKTIDDSDVDVHEKINSATGLAYLTGNSFVDNNQSKISEFAERLKNSVDDGELKSNSDDMLYLLTGLYESTVVENSVSPYENNADLVNVDEFVFDYRRLVQDLYRDYHDWDSDKTQERLFQLTEKSSALRVPQV